MLAGSNVKQDQHSLSVSQLENGLTIVKATIITYRLLSGPAARWTGPGSSAVASSCGRTGLHICNHCARLPG